MSARPLISRNVLGGKATAALRQTLVVPKVSATNKGSKVNNLPNFSRSHRHFCAMAMENPGRVDQLTGSLQVQKLPSGLGRILINRPRTLNAMDTDMVEMHRAALRSFWMSDIVSGALVASTDPRAFCSGGDVKRIREEVLRRPFWGTPRVIIPLPGCFQAEYNLVLDIHNSKVPTLHCGDGVWMGLGCRASPRTGTSASSRREPCLRHGPRMPLGLFPDVGFAYLAAKCQVRWACTSD
eukprot:jgi/Botrbrau1/8429/Bobra.0237s0048.1